MLQPLIILSVQSYVAFGTSCCVCAVYVQGCRFDMHSLGDSLRYIIPLQHGMHCIVEHVHSQRSLYAVRLQAGSYVVAVLGVISHQKDCPGHCILQDVIYTDLFSQTK